jgi:hypothetical protein
MRDSTRRRWPPRSRRARPLATAVVSGLLVAGCGGGSGSPPAVAVSSITTSASSTPTAATPPGDPAGLLVEWASCMRRHGDPNQADPTITVGRVIEIVWNSAIPGGYGGTNKGGEGNSGPGQYCRTYLAAAQAALRAGRLPERPGQAATVKLAACMRANGVPDFPDPSANGSVILPGNPDQNANNPTFQDASKVCARKTGVSLPGRSSLPAGTITLSGR